MLTCGCLARCAQRANSSAFASRGGQTAFYYLNDVEGGGETAFPAADGAMTPSEALALSEPQASGGGLVVKPERGAALLWYNHAADGTIDPFAVHAGCRVTAGEKWGANHWVRMEAAPASPAAKPPADAEPADAEPGTGKNAAKNKKKREKAAAKKAAADGT